MEVVYALKGVQRVIYDFRRLFALACSKNVNDIIHISCSRSAYGQFFFMCFIPSFFFFVFADKVVCLKVCNLVLIKENLSFIVEAHIWD